MLSKENMPVMSVLKEEPLKFSIIFHPPPSQFPPSLNESNMHIFFNSMLKGFLNWLGSSKQKKSLRKL